MIAVARKQAVDEHVRRIAEARHDARQMRLLVAGQRRAGDAARHRIEARILAGRENRGRENGLLAAIDGEAKMRQEQYAAVFERGYSVRSDTGRRWIGPAGLREGRQTGQFCSSSPHGEGCGPGRIPAMSGSSSPAW